MRYPALVSRPDDNPISAPLIDVFGALPRAVSRPFDEILSELETINTDNDTDKQNNVPCRADAVFRVSLCGRTE